MTKEEKIKEAWGKDFPKHKEVDGNGWSIGVFWYEDFDFKKFDTIEISHGYYIIRPESLKGIENNNGWNSMEQPDFEENEYVLFLRYINGEGEPPIFTCVLCDDFEIGYFTHWKRVDYGKPPIY